eukprot:6376155-Prymnesium_polylepis.1
MVRIDVIEDPAHLDASSFHEPQVGSCRRLIEGARRRNRITRSGPGTPGASVITHADAELVRSVGTKVPLGAAGHGETFATLRARPIHRPNLAPLE